MSGMIQAQNGTFLEGELGLKNKGTATKVGGVNAPGNPQVYEVTQATVTKIQSLVGKSIEVDSDGKLSLSS